MQKICKNVNCKTIEKLKFIKLSKWTKSHKCKKSLKSTDGIWDKRVLVSVGFEFWHINWRGSSLGFSSVHLFWE